MRSIWHAHKIRTANLPRFLEELQKQDDTGSFNVTAVKNIMEGSIPYTVVTSWRHFVNTGAEAKMREMEKKLS